MSRTISRDELKAKLDRGEAFQLVNVLMPDSYEAEHVPGSINVPVPEIEQYAARNWDWDDEIVVYCASFNCKASVRAAAKLENMGFTNVAEFDGGTEDWAEAGYYVARGKDAA